MSINAFWASSSLAKVTYPKPFDLFLTLSMIMLAGKGEELSVERLLIRKKTLMLGIAEQKLPSRTSPNFENASANVSSVVENDIPATKS
jgi:hypothetical protein